MIRRRSVITGICCLIAEPTALRAFSIMPVSATSCSGIDPTAVPSAAPVTFKIRGWDQSDLGGNEKAGQQVVVIHLTNSWRAAWL